jgi:DNA-binding transcriptional LysR family regulator
MLRLTLDALQVLDAIARCGTFAAAAGELHRTTSTLSYTVKKLEDDLGVQLFDRSGYRATLTNAGHLLRSSVACAGSVTAGRPSS